MMASSWDLQFKTLSKKRVTFLLFQVTFLTAFYQKSTS
jgi:hypothetical protein